VVPHSIVRSGDYKLIYYFDETPPELYDLENDPMEKVNLAAQFPSRVSDLKFKLENWWQETGARLPEKN
jgi:arylsulfatase A-like enzyme